MIFSLLNKDPVEHKPIGFLLVTPQGLNHDMIISDHNVATDLLTVA